MISFINYLTAVALELCLELLRLLLELLRLLLELLELPGLLPALGLGKQLVELLLR